jgi:hypothetical protein
MPIKQTQGFNIHTGISDFGSSISVQEIDDLEVISPGPGGVISFSDASLTNIKNISSVELDTDTIVARSIKADLAAITDVTSTSLNTVTAAIVTLRAGFANITEATIATLHSTAIDSARMVTVNLTAAVASLTQLTSSVGDIETLGAGSLAVRGDATIKGNELLEGNLQVNKNVTINGNELVKGNLQVDGNVQISGLLTIAEATIATLHTTTVDCVRLLAVNLSAAIAGFAQITATSGDIETASAGTLTVRGDATIIGSLKAGNIISTVLTIVADNMGFYVWTHAALRPPVFYSAIPEGGEVLRLMSTNATSARFFFYSAAPLRVHFLAIGV